MRILLVSNMFPSKKYPSAGIFVKRFCEELDKINVSYDLAVMHWHKNKLLKICSYIIFYIITVLKILLKQYDLIYIHYASHSSIPVLIANKFKKIRVFTNVHGSDVVPVNTRQEKFQKYTKAALALSDKIIVPSVYFKQYVKNKYDIEADKIIVYPSCGVDRKKFMKLKSNQVQDLKKKIGIMNNNVVFSYISRITTRKGWDTYLKAVSILINKGYMANFIVVGDGNENEKYNTFVEKLGLTSKILKFPLMSQLELMQMYNCTDAFIFPTEGESLGLVAIEAMACGTPVIASDFSAPKHYIINGYNGLQFEMGNESRLAEEMLKFINGSYKKSDFSTGTDETANNYSNTTVQEILKDLFYGDMI